MLGLSHGTLNRLAYEKGSLKDLFTHVWVFSTLLPHVT